MFQARDCLPPARRAGDPGDHKLAQDPVACAAPGAGQPVPSSLRPNAPEGFAHADGEPRFLTHFRQVDVATPVTGRRADRSRHIPIQLGGQRQAKRLPRLPEAPRHRLAGRHESIDLRVGPADADMLAIRCRTLRPTRTDSTIRTLRRRHRRPCLMRANMQAACPPDRAVSISGC